MERIGPDFFKRTDEDIEKGEKEIKLEILRDLQEKTLELWAKSETNAKGNQEDNSEEIKKGIGEIADKLSLYILDANVDRPIVHAYNSAVALQIDYNNHNSEMRGELRMIATLLNRAEAEELAERAKE